MSAPNENRAGYKETKVGWIPDDWEAQPLHSFVKSHNAGVYKKSKLYGQGTNIVGVSDLYDIHRIDGKEFRRVPLSDEEKIKYTLRAGDLLYGESSLVREGIARTVHTTRAGAGCGFAWHTRRYSVDDKRLLPVYLYYYLQAWPARVHMMRTCIQTAITGINTTDYFQCPIPVLSLLEQQRIAEILSTCDEAIEKAGALIDAKGRQKKALMQQLLTGKKRLPGFKTEWKVRELSAVLSHVFRPVEWAPDEIFHLVSIRRRSMGLFRREPLRGDEYKTTDLHELKAGDFVISKRQVTHGALAMVTEEFDGCHVSKEYSIFVNKDPKGFHMPFFDWLSRTRRLWWLAYVASNGVVIEKLIFDPKTFLKFEVLLPPSIEEQTAIAQVLDTCDWELQTLDKRLTALKQQKKALMQKLLTGQVRVKV